jgi:MFS superfamily sulfate permease-like transporter
MSAVMVFLKIAKPNIPHLGYLPNNLYSLVSKQERPDCLAYDGVIIIRFEEPLLFLNQATFRETLITLSKDKSSTLPLVIIVDMSKVTDIDGSAVHTLKEVYADIKASNVELLFLQTQDQVNTVLERSGIFSAIDTGSFHKDLKSCLDAAKVSISSILDSY